MASEESAERHVLVVANETIVGHDLIDTLKKRAAEGPIRVTVVAPINHPRAGFVVYHDTRRASAGRRLDRTLHKLREVGIPAHGLVVDADPVDAVRDALAQLEPDEVIVSTHPKHKSGWLRGNKVERIRRLTSHLPFHHVVVDLSKQHAETNVLVVANETVLGEPLLAKIRERHGKGPASFLIVSPQGEAEGSYDEAERRLRRAIRLLRSEGIDAHGHVAHPDAYQAAIHAIEDERVDEVIVSTFPHTRSGWLRRDLVGRLRKDTGLPVDHVMAEEHAEVGAS
jgi:phosphopantetheine adenylyltransferase